MFNSQTIGIDIGVKNTVIIVGAWNGNYVQIKKAIMVPTPVEAVNEGRIMNLERMIPFLRNILKEHHIKKGYVVFTTENVEVIQREIVLPKLSKKEIDSMIPFEIETNFPVKVEDYCFEYQQLEELNEDGVKKVKLLVAAMPKDIVENYLFLAEKIGLTPQGLKLQGGCISQLFAKTKSVNDIPIDHSATMALIDIGHATMQISFVYMGRQVFSRSVAFKSKDLTEMIASELGITAQKAESLKMQCSLIRQLDEPLDPVGKSLRQVMQEKADEWTQELQPIFRYYLSLSESNKIDQIILYGGYSMIPGIAEYFQEVFNRPAQVVQSLSVLEFSDKTSDVPLSYLLNAAGSLIKE